MKKLGLRWLPALGMMAAIFILSSTPGAALDSVGLGPWQPRKTLHMLGYALLAASFLFALGWPSVSRPGWAWALSALYAVSDEFHQLFVPGRGSSPLDVVIDSLGALLGLWLCLNLARMMQKRRRQI